MEATLAGIGVTRLHPGPYLNEFVVHIPGARAVHRRLLERGFLAGLALADAEPSDPSLADGLLLCATEVTTSEEIGRFVTALGEVLAESDLTGTERDAVHATVGAANTAGAAR